MKTLHAPEDLTEAFRQLRPDALSTVLAVCRIAQKHFPEAGASTQSESNVVRSVLAAAEQARASHATYHMMIRALMALSHDINEDLVVVTVQKRPGKDAKDAFVEHMMAHVCPNAAYHSFRTAMLGYPQCLRVIDGNCVVFERNPNGKGKALAQLFARIEYASEISMATANCMAMTAQGALPSEGEDAPR